LARSSGGPRLLAWPGDAPPVMTQVRVQPKPVESAS
jgi:hypothetical protein